MENDLTNLDRLHIQSQRDSALQNSQNFDNFKEYDENRQLLQDSLLNQTYLNEFDYSVLQNAQRCNLKQLFDFLVQNCNTNEDTTTYNDEFADLQSVDFGEPRDFDAKCYINYEVAELHNLQCIYYDILRGKGPPSPLPVDPESQRDEERVGEAYPEGQGPGVYPDSGSGSGILPEPCYGPFEGASTKGSGVYPEERSDEGESRDVIPRSVASEDEVKDKKSEGSSDKDGGQEKRVYPTREAGILPAPCYESFEDASTKDRGVYPEERSDEGTRDEVPRSTASNEDPGVYPEERRSTLKSEPSPLSEALPPPITGFGKNSRSEDQGSTLESEGQDEDGAKLKDEEGVREPGFLQDSHFEEPSITENKISEQGVIDLPTEDHKQKGSEGPKDRPEERSDEVCGGRGMESRDVPCQPLEDAFTKDPGVYPEERRSTPKSEGESLSEEPSPPITGRGKNSRSEERARASIQSTPSTYSRVREGIPANKDKVESSIPYELITSDEDESVSSTLTLESISSVTTSTDEELDKKPSKELEVSDESDISEALVEDITESDESLSEEEKKVEPAVAKEDKTQGENLDTKPKEPLDKKRRKNSIIHKGFKTIVYIISGDKNATFAECKVKYDVKRHNLLIKKSNQTFQIHSNNISASIISKPKEIPIYLKISIFGQSTTMVLTFDDINIANQLESLLNSKSV